jgi:uncharacterized coiled-coil DUF342 family protein
VAAAERARELRGGADHADAEEAGVSKSQERERIEAIDAAREALRDAEEAVASAERWFGAPYSRIDETREWERTVETRLGAIRSGVKAHRLQLIDLVREVERS